MKAWKAEWLTLLTGAAFAVWLTGAFGQDPSVPPADPPATEQEEEPGEDEDEPQPPGEIPPVLQNPVQMEKAAALSEASGVSQEEIIRMRLGLPPEGMTEVPVDQPQGRGWGVIARWLGIHPGTLGRGHDRKPDSGEGMLVRREKMRGQRLDRERGECDMDADAADAKAERKARQKDVLSSGGRGGSEGRGRDGSGGGGKDDSKGKGKGHGKGRGGDKGKHGGKGH
jgi:hypothetical protein